MAKKKSVFVTLVIIFALILAALYIYAYVIPDISGALTETYIVTDGTVVTSLQADCIVIRNEITYTASASGKVNYYIEEGEKTRINTRILDIQTGSSQERVHCKQTGFVSYCYDGYEGILNPESVLEMEPSSYIDISDSTKSMMLNPSETVQKGEFIYKLVDGSAWYLMIPVTDEQVDMFKMGSRLNILLSDGTSFMAEAQKVLGENGRVIMAKVTSYYPDFAKHRRLDVQIITKETSGLLIPKSAVGKNADGNQGVYVLGTDGEYHFTRILILEEEGENYLIQPSEFTEYYEDGTSKGILSVDLYDEIRRNANG